MGLTIDFSWQNEPIQKEEKVMDLRRGKEEIVFSLDAIGIDELGRVIIKDAQLAASLKTFKDKGEKYYPITVKEAQVGNYCIVISSPCST